nr:ATP-binding cassette domain-containing protein [uncultured Oscillibacter sp.]
MKKEVLRVEHLTKYYEALCALDDFTFSLYQGEILGLAGLNGSGKTTLANILSGNRQPDSGTIWINGAIVSISSSNVARDLGIYYVGQRSDLVPNLSIAENLSVLSSHNSRQLFFNWKSDCAKTRRFLEEMGMPFSVTDKCSALSQVQQHMLQIAKGLFLGCRVLIVDNVTNAYSPCDQEVFFDLLRRVQKLGCSVLFISQNPQQLFRVSDRVLVLRRGYYAGQLFPGEYRREKLMSMLVGHTYSERSSRHVSAADTEVLRVTHLSTSHYHDLNFVLHKREILGISDVTSSDRFALFNLFTGREPLQAGDISIHGQNIGPLTPQNLLKHRVGFIAPMSTGTALFSNLTVAENISLLQLGRLSNRFGVLRPHMERYAMQELQEQQLFPDWSLNTKVKDLRIDPEHEIMILLERWRQIAPHVLLLCDIFLDLDPIVKKRVWNRLVEIALCGTAIILASSGFSDMLTHCDRIIELENGLMVER